MIGRMQQEKVGVAQASRSTYTLLQQEPVFLNPTFVVTVLRLYVESGADMER